MMGRHRSLVTKLVLTEVRENGTIEWIDNPFTNLRDDRDAPLFGLHFLKQINISSEVYKSIKTEYDALFQNCHDRVAWDAIGKTSSGTIILLKAISYPEELYSVKNDRSDSAEHRNNAIDDFSAAIDCIANAYWKDYYSSYVQELQIAWILNKNGIKAKHITLCLVPEIAAYQESVLNLRAAIAKRNSDLAIAKSSLVRIDSCICYLGISGDMVYDSTQEEEVIYREWFLEKVVVLVGGFGATAFERLHGIYNARYILLDKQSSLSAKKIEKPEIFTNKYLTMINLEDLIRDKDIFLSNLAEGNTARIVHIVAGTNGKTARDTIRAIINIQSFPIEKAIFLLVEPFEFENAGKEHEVFRKEIQERCKCQIVNVQAISDAMDKSQKLVEFEHYLVSEIAQIIF
jgi:hypothetical protein